LKAPRLDIESEPLLYWKNEHSFPLIKQLVKKYLCAPPSSVESERLFSTAGNIYTNKRNKLSGEHAEQQLFLHHHWWSQQL
jgi:hypothetical protein